MDEERKLAALGRIHNRMSATKGKPTDKNKGKRSKEDLKNSFLEIAKERVKQRSTPTKSDNAPAPAAGDDSSTSSGPAMYREYARDTQAGGRAMAPSHEEAESSPTRQPDDVGKELDLLLPENWGAARAKSNSTAPEEEETSAAIQSTETETTTAIVDTTKTVTWLYDIFGKVDVGKNGTAPCRFLASKIEELGLDGTPWSEAHGLTETLRHEPERIITEAKYRSLVDQWSADNNAGTAPEESAAPQEVEEPPEEDAEEVASRDKAASEKRTSTMIAVFQAFDADSSGYLDKCELRRIGIARRELGQRKVTWSGKRNDELFRRLDLNEDGIVSQAEFVKVFGQILPEDPSEFGESVDQLLEAAQLVRVCDPIDLDIAHLHRQMLGKERSLLQLFMIADRNKDDKLSFDEFEEGVALMGFRPYPSPSEMRALFDAIDCDDDGYIQHSELTQWQSPLIAMRSRAHEEQQRRQQQQQQQEAVHEAGEQDGGHDSAHDSAHGGGEEYAGPSVHVPAYQTSQAGKRETRAVSYTHLTLPTKRIV
eukprot:TRINITY_DN5240_c0_g1_i11.p1 TRINITY_DN5240_c0_g1~~TRINITY_DN5240_c0_g1_i11.p1  ORF type:complete len:539 (-),score=156.80 TRINITY_DN5240_c0_g1_i11:47-1663(-)